MSYSRSSPGYTISFPSLTPAVKLLLLINAAVFVAHAIVEPLAPGWFSGFFGASWSRILEWLGLGAVRLVTYQFVHSFDGFFHIFFNMLVLYFFGTLVEASIGRERLIKLYLGAGLLGGLVFVIVTGLQGLDVPVIGASGACYGIMVYAACLAPRMRVIFLIFPIELRWLVGFLVFMGIYSSYVGMVRGGGGDGVAHSAHLGGAAFGFIAYRWPLGRWQVWRRFDTWRARRRAQADVETRKQVDELLEKVHREGLTSLTPGERRFLDAASRRLKQD